MIFCDTPIPAFALGVRSRIVFVSQSCRNTSAPAVWFQTTQLDEDSPGSQWSAVGLREPKSGVGDAAFLWELGDRPFPGFSQLLEVTVVAYDPVSLSPRPAAVGKSFSHAVSAVLSASRFRFQQSLGCIGPAWKIRAHLPAQGQA